MDFARKIGKSDKPRRTWKKCDIPFVTTRDNLLSEDVTSFPEDHRLVNWRKWLEARKQQNHRIESAGGRPPADQLYNTSERFRTLVETRDLMEHAAVPAMVADKCRGGLEFWKTPESLPDHGVPCQPKVSVTLSRRELNLPSDLTHVGLSDLTMYERDLGGLLCKEEPWKRSTYLRGRKIELAKEIASLLPKEPETAALYVQGRTFRAEKAQPRIPPITITTECDEEEEKDPREDTLNEATVLRIQDREFIWRRSLRNVVKSLDTDPIIWSLIFACEIDERVEREIVLENKGIRVIVYHWRDACFRSSNMPVERRGGPFFFNKTKGLVLPGQIVKIKVWYRSRIRGVFTESWRLVTEPELSTSAFVFRFWGSATDSRNAELTYHRIIDEHLNRCVRDSMIRSIIEEITAGIECDKQPELTRKAQFWQDRLYDSMNPSRFYCPSRKAMQSPKIQRERNASPWNLALDVLEEILSQVGGTDYRYNTFAQFDSLCKRCLRSDSYGVARNKYNVVYNILCTFANLFENESELAKNDGSMWEELVAPMEMHRLESISSLQTSDGNSQEAHSEKSIHQTESLRVQEEETSTDLKFQSYKKVFLGRIYIALEEAIKRISIVIDSFNRLNETDE